MIKTSVSCAERESTSRVWTPKRSFPMRLLCLHLRLAMTGDHLRNSACQAWGHSSIGGWWGPQWRDDQVLSNNHLTRLPRNRSAVFASSSLYYVIAKSILDMLVISNCRTHISILCCASSIPFIACFVFMVRYRWSFRNVTVNSNDHVTIRLSLPCTWVTCLAPQFHWSCAKPLTLYLGVLHASPWDTRSTWPQFSMCHQRAAAGRHLCADILQSLFRRHLPPIIVRLIRRKKASLTGTGDQAGYKQLSTSKKEYCASTEKPCS